MKKSNQVLLICLLVSLITACASIKPVAYRDLASSQHLIENHNKKQYKEPYIYKTNVNWKSYNRAIIAPVTIYQGSDHQLQDLNQQQQQELAQYMHQQFEKALSSRFQITSGLEPETLLIKLTLTGATKTNTFLGPITKFDIGGSLYNGVQSIRGREGAFMGSVMYVVEIYDAQTQKLIEAKVVKQYPNSYNIGASVGALKAAKVGIEKGAEELAHDF
ncbi:DUF3313 domain-containing protein [Acinetobacter qingfengensis]|uniref:Uncharacterized protein n=1 Tax=Acinetobacter qingfengensis TaxID=1262585 RepID=A0A1E7RER9_9GAMM|nr:DUF3313 domain-containing protein [Acinetobacter qingfengensis]KAA8735690.1 DUF3313 domain-containing protein [Acinetobacter qingfengensis]OEY97864.1 hypothetical protein BJI46_07280 [Acinetobacter qingfengensis]